MPVRSPRPRALWLALFTMIVAAACRESDRSRVDGSSSDATAVDAATQALPPGSCTFPRHGDPNTAAGSEDVINVPLERLVAPPGGLWWVKDALEGDTVVVSGDAGLVQLQVAERVAPLSAIRVPELPRGTRLVMGGRGLLVGEPAPRPNFEEVVLRYAYRPDLGGTGVTIAIAPAMRGRVLVYDAWVGRPGVNVAARVHVLERLLLPDTPTICNPSRTDDEPLFIPMWTGETGQSLGVRLVDADDLGNSKFLQLCLSALQPQSCPPCHGC